MIKARIQVEEMHVYYFIAKKLISGAKLGIFGMTSGEEKLLKKVYSCSEVDIMDNLVKKLSDKLEERQAKLDELVLNSNDTKQFITDAVNCVKDLKYKSDVLENVLKFLKPEFTTSQKITLCIEKIVQAKRVLAGLSPEEKKTIISTADFDFKKSSNIHMKVTAVDAENIKNKKTALIDNNTGEKIAVSSVPIIDATKGNIISNNIDKNIVKIADKKVVVEADVEILDSVESVETLVEIEELEDSNDSNNSNVVSENNEKVYVEEILEVNNTELVDKSINSGEEDKSCEELDNRESIASSYVGVVADDFSTNPLDYYSVGSSIYDKDSLEYNIPTIEPAYEIIGNFKKTGFGDAFDRTIINDFEEELENSIPIVEEFSANVISNENQEKEDMSVGNLEVLPVVDTQVKEEVVFYDEPVIFKVIETDGVSVE